MTWSPGAARARSVLAELADAIFRLGRGGGGMGVAPAPGGWHMGVYGGCVAGFGVFRRRAGAGPPDRGEDDGGTRPPGPQATPATAGSLAVARRGRAMSCS